MIWLAFCVADRKRRPMTCPRHSMVPQSLRQKSVTTFCVPLQLYYRGQRCLHGKRGCSAAVAFCADIVARLYRVVVASTSFQVKMFSMYCKERVRALVSIEGHSDELMPPFVDNARFPEADAIAMHSVELACRQLARRNRAEPPLPPSTIP
jgi:hypothetical protein